MPAHEDPDGAPDAATETRAPSVTAPGDPTARFTPGTMLAARYRLVAPLGKGGMGEVYRADDIRLGQPVALKFLPPGLARDHHALKRLKDEVSIGRQISHPNVCRLYDIAEAAGLHFLVMEYVDGEDLASLLRRIGRLPADKALEIARGLCAGLAAAHDRGVIHRDLKPANVMIDGRGHARIADFGLAVPASDGRAHGFAGTMNYMAPEQLAGEGASPSSDIFALGLVLYEMFTGRRVFEAHSIEALQALHAGWKPEILSSSASDIDRGVQRVILRCLAREPGERPVSALAVVAALPGGDPLQAAIAQGDTPSPEMVAAASVVGNLSPLIAWACLVAGLLGLVSIAILSERVTLFRQVPLPRPPEAMADRARDVLSRLGYQEAGADSAHGFFTDFAFLEFVAQRDSPPTGWAVLRNARPGPLLFFHRESPRPLVSTSWIPVPPWEGASELGVVSAGDPPMNVPGMTRVTLDRLGRLTSFVAVPPLFDPDPPPASAFDWSIVLAEAGFDLARVKPAASGWTPPVGSDLRAAWDGPLEGQPDVPFHIEAAANRGRLVSFVMRGPWVQPPAASAVAPITRASLTAVVVLQVLIAVLGGVWARRNWRLGRGDRNGARRLATFVFAALTIASLVLAEHTSSPIVELSLLVLVTGQGLFAAMLAWLQYIALEPFVRRRWPHTLISWTRLLSGRIRDPLIGGAVLVGVLAGMILVLVLRLDAAHLFAEGLASATIRDWSTPLTSRELAYLLFVSPCLAVLFSVGFLFILSLFQTIVRHAWLARVMLSLLFLLLGIIQTPDPWRGVFGAGVLAAIVITVLVRFGLLSCAALLFTFAVLNNAPLTLDWSAWHSGGSFAVLALFVAVLAAAFYTSLAGRPVFGRTLIED